MPVRPANRTDSFRGEPGSFRQSERYNLVRGPMIRPEIFAVERERAACERNTCQVLDSRRLLPTDWSARAARATPRPKKWIGCLPECGKSCVGLNQALPPLFDVRCSVFDLRCSIFDVRCCAFTCSKCSPDAKRWHEMSRIFSSLSAFNVGRWTLSVER
jgi:hypothetical protein